MAAAPVICGFCLRRDGEMRDPRRLPCFHVHCLECLTSQKDAISRSKCPLEDCHEPFQSKMENLPVVELSIVSYGCQAEECVESADVFCQFPRCLKTYCSHHGKVHNEVHKEGHTTISIDQYRPQANKLQQRTCSKHKGKACKRGCSICMSVFCETCIGESGMCYGGQEHDFLSLDVLSQDLLERTFSLTQRLEVKEARLADLSSRAVKCITDHNLATRGMMVALQKKRDEQISAIQLKYLQLEKNLEKQRSQTKCNLNTFLDHEVREMQDNLRTTRLRTEAKVRQDHQVDVIEEHEERTDRMRRLLNEEMPALSLTDVAKIVPKGEQRQPELSLIQTTLSVEYESFFTSA